MSKDASDIREPHLRRGDFLGVFAIVARADRFLFVQNRRVIGGREALTWDLPGGQVEPGELLREALARELGEEVGVEVDGDPELAFFQEGERTAGGRRKYAWRSFFFRVPAIRGEPAASGEVLAVRWLAAGELAALLTAPYHDSFLSWVARPQTEYRSRWCD